MRDITCEHAVLGIPSDFSGMYCLSRPPSVRLTKWAISVPDACNSAPGGGETDSCIMRYHLLSLKERSLCSVFV